ncbi:MAG TPA: DUF922 domain-containing protein [Acidimicrobiales bacterium]
MTDWGTEEYEVYEVSGATLQDVADAISGMPEAGKCEWLSSYSYDCGDGNTIVSATATVVIKITMPSWADSDSASPEAQAEFKRWWDALLAHENGHREIAERHLDGIENGMVGKTPSEAADYWTAQHAELQRLSDEYDSRNNHGISEGTTLDTSIQ